MISPCLGWVLSTLALSLLWIPGGIAVAEEGECPSNVHGVGAKTLPEPYADLEGKNVFPTAPKDGLHVLIFTTVDCPVANAYQPRIREIAAALDSEQVRFFLVHVDASVDGKAVRQHAKEYQVEATVLRDPTHALVSWAGAEITPEAVVVGGGSKVLYRGRIDDWYSKLGQRRAEPRNHDLLDALRALIAGNEVAVDGARPVGCYIDDMPVEQPDLVTPVMTEEKPAPGLRVRQTAPEYAGTDVYHTLYLPTDWKPGKTYPVIVEYTGNEFPKSGSTGKVKDANLGFGITGGVGAIWVTLPYVQKGLKENAVTWWGDRQATIDYCTTNLPRICKSYGGDTENVFVCGFSRGAIGISYVGLANDEIAAFWKGFITHDHFDGERSWGYPESDRSSALARLARLRGRPVLVCGVNASAVRDNYLKDHLELAAFTFLDVHPEKIFDIPEGPVVHRHTDAWMHRDSDYRVQVRAWLASRLKPEK